MTINRLRHVPLNFMPEQISSTCVGGIMQRSIITWVFIFRITNWWCIQTQDTLPRRSILNGRN